MGKTNDAVTLADVARAAGVSIATASKALNGKTVVRESTRRHVEEVARSLAFTPNPFARALNSSITGTIGVLTADLANRFVVPILLGVEDAFGADSTSVILTDARNDAIRESHQLRTLVAKRVDGIIVLGDSDTSRPSITEQVSVPVAYAFAASQDPNDSSFTTDNIQGTDLAIDHLVSRGRRNIVAISGDPTFSAAVERLVGAMQAVQRHGLQLVGGENLFGDWSEDWGRQCVHALVEAGHHFDAIFCASDQIARGAIEQLRDENLRVPEDVAVVGYDNWELFSVHSRPPITTIDMNLQELGQAVAHELIDAIKGHPHPGVHRVPVRLIPRASTTRL